MELDHLRTFVAVVEAGGFTRAASILASTQPTLSRQVAALESSLGQPLLERLGRRVALTPFGKELLPRARELLRDADALLSSGRAAEGGPLSGELRLGVADSVIFSTFPPVLERFMARHRQVQVHVTSGTSPRILAWVREGRCDAGLCMLPAAHPGLVLRPFWTDRFVAIAPPSHPLARRAVSLAEFAAERQVVIRPGTLSHQVLTAAYQSEGLSLVPDMDFDGFQLINEFVAAGVGVGLSSAQVSRPYLKEKRVARVRIEAIDRLQRRLGLALHADRALTGPLGALVAEIEGKGGRRRKGVSRSSRR